MSNSRLTIRLSWTSISKLIYLLYTLYLGFYQNAFKAIPGLASVFVVALVFTTFMDVNSKGERLLSYANKAIFTWIVFIAYVLVTGVCIASNYTIFFNRLFFYASNVAVVMCIAVIVKREGNLNYIMKVWALNALLLGVFLIFSGSAITTSTGVFYSAREGSNRNIVAMYLMFGIFGVLNLSIVNKMKHGLIPMAYVALMTYAIILTASRKGLIGVAILLVVWFVFSFRYVFRTFKPAWKLLTVVVVIGVIGVVIYYFQTAFQNTYIFERLFGDAGDDSSVARWRHVENTFEMFKEHPLIGVGFNQYRVYIGTYAHMNYAEILADTGLIGFVLYYSTYVAIMFRLLKKMSVLSKNGFKNNVIALANVAMFIGLFVVIIVLETGMVAIQDFMMPIALGVISICCYSDILVTK